MFLVPSNTLAFFQLGFGVFVKLKDTKFVEQKKKTVNNWVEYRVNYQITIPWVQIWDAAHCKQVRTTSY